ncbi:MAG TPA: mechanosensitive ion channel family protein [Solirubrobacterales bacterium]
MKRARIESLVLLPVLVAVLVVYHYRERLFGSEWETVVRIFAVLALVSLGWQFVRDIGRALRPILFRRLDPSTAGTVGFVIQLSTLLTVIFIALRVAGLTPRTLAFGGALTAVVIGLAAQQTLSNLIAGTVLISARSFRIGDRVRFQGGGLAGSVEGVVSGLGLLYTTLAGGEDLIMVPNSIVLNVAVVPLREPDAVDLRVRLRRGVPPVEVERLLGEMIKTPTRGPARVQLEELNAREVIARISATPRHAPDGARLAGEVLEAVAPLTVEANGECALCRHGRFPDDEEVSEQQSEHPV